MFSRRAFVRGRAARSAVAGLRPPWALPELAFQRACTRCDDCIRVCPTHVLVRGEGGFPTVNFSQGECTFCGDCVRACRPGALRVEDGGAAWHYRARINEACLAKGNVECRICGEACGVGAIRFRLRVGGVPLPELDVAACTGCGACVAPCPAQAISVMQDVEEAP